MHRLVTSLEDAIRSQSNGAALLESPAIKSILAQIKYQTQYLKPAPEFQIFLNKIAKELEAEREQIAVMDNPSSAAEAKDTAMQGLNQNFTFRYNSCGNALDFKKIL